MPVPTETFWHIRKLNVIFAASAVLLTVSTLLLILADYNHDWRGYQKDARVWETAMTVDAQRQAEASGQRDELNAIKEKLAALEAKLPHKEITRLESEIQRAKDDKAALDLPTAAVKGLVNPKIQEIEQAALDHGDNSPQVKKLRQELAYINKNLERKLNTVAGYDQVIADKTAELNKLRASLTDLTKERDDLIRRQTALQERLSSLEPSGMAKFSDFIRDQPLLNWMNPREAVQQVVVEGVRTDYNFVTTETIDRCNTCHINIDKGAFEPDHEVAFVERQVAMAQGQDVNDLDHPVVMLRFWVSAADHLADLSKDDFHKQAVLDAVKKIRQDAVDRLNQLRSAAGLKPLDSADKLDGEIQRITTNLRGKEVKGWYAPIQEYNQDLRDLLQARLGKEQFGQLMELYRVAVTDVYNGLREKEGLAALDTNPVLLGHPNLERYVDPDSTHPMKVMGCTVCHEGSGQEADFVHTAHMPRDIWVDAQTGAPVPDGLVAEVGQVKKMQEAVRVSGHVVSPQKMTQADNGPRIVTVALESSAQPGEPAASPETGEAGQSPQPGGEGVYTHHDVNLADPNNPAPFAPRYEPEGDAAVYHNPADAGGVVRLAVRQADYWTKKYKWESVSFKDWEHPMNSMAYIESSCAKCHGEVFDLKDAAPTLFEGRKLFAQLGCVNCHAVAALEKAGDTTIKIDQIGPDGQPTGKEETVPRKVAPSLVHVKDKLSPQMIASWIWAPKAFRPSTRMPDFFMLENNSAPVDILRTRVEVAAITYYLTHAKPAVPTPEYAAETPPDKTGDVESGRKIFNTVGCLACHTNMAEHGEYLIVNDLIKNSGLDVDAAKKRYDSMTYNQRQWYAVDHLEDKLINIGPELSAVGTKLTLGRTPEQARAWLYDWLHNPRHYSSYTIMPNFRLSDQEANDLSAYLLSLKRDDYKGGDFLDLKTPQKKMLAELVATLKSAQSTIKIARQQVEGTNGYTPMSQDDQLMFLGQKMIGNYGCNGCHLIDGFENATSACTNLDDWGTKDPHKLDFGYFDAAFDKEREKPIDVWKVRHEGLGANAPQINYDDKADVVQVPLRWEQMDEERRPWAYNKLHNPRVYDRGREMFNGKIEGEGDNLVIDTIGKPYDKLKMPKFFLKDEQVHALVTFVTSIRKPLVTQDLINSTYDDPHRRWAYGQQVATMFNCYGCHNIEGNSPHIREWFDYLPTGEFNPDGYKWAPPRLLGQGSKTQPQWVYFFLQNVDTRIRPWLQIRMPSFPIGAAHAGHITDYFAGQSQIFAKDLKTWLEKTEATLHMPEADLTKGLAAWQGQVADWVAKNPSREDWFDAESAALPIGHLRDYAIMADLVKDEDLNPRTASPQQRRDAWALLWFNLHYVQETYDIHYPYVPQSRPEISPDRFARGEKFIKQLGCLAGNCHSLGDPDVLAQIAELDRKAAEAANKAAASQASSGGSDYGYGDNTPSTPAATPTTSAPAATASSAGGDDYGSGDNTQGAKPKTYVGNWIPAAPPGDPGALGARNLIRTGYRIQRSYENHWIESPTTLVPGTWMLELFPDHGQSAFLNVPPEVRKQLESMYGYDGQQQRDLLLDFLYAASDRDYTPGAAERLYGAKPPQIDLKPLPPPPSPTTRPAGPGQQSAAPAPSPEVAPPPVAPPPPAPAAEPAKSAIQLQDQPSAAYQGTRVVGVVKFTGAPEQRRRIDLAADAVCVAAHPNAQALTEGLIVNKDNTLRNAFIYVKSGLPAGQNFPAKQQPAMNQVGCVYVPHVVGMVAGQNLDITNGDPTLHNVKMVSRNNGSFNEGMPVQGMVIQKKFSQPELGIPVRCNVHGWMLGVVNVVNNPFFAVSDVEGRYEITGLPPGKYTLEAIHEDKRVPPVTFDVEVKADTSVRADVTMNGQ